MTSQPNPVLGAFLHAGALVLAGQELWTHRRGFTYRGRTEEAAVIRRQDPRAFRVWTVIHLLAVLVLLAFAAWNLLA